MDDQEYITSLEARIYRMETTMQKLLTILTTSGANMTPQKPPEIGAIREALLSGDKIKAIKLYRGLYGVGLKEARDAIEAM